MEIIPIPCLSDNYAYIIYDSNSKTVGVVDHSEATPIINFLKKKNTSSFYFRSVGPIIIQQKLKHKEFQLSLHTGIFKEANTVIIDTKFLSTLSERELKSGFAEIIKHCLIKDSFKFDEISNNLEWEKNNWNDLVNHSIDIKSQVVKLDLKEVGFRKILNYGHTLGHAIETTYMSKQNKLLHGEAIAIGMICEAYISFYFNKLTKDELNKISNFITKIFNLQEINYFEEIIKHTFQDKKNVNQKIRTCVLNGIGDCEYDIEINPNLILDSLEYYNKIL